jgi:hypothetical protein
MLSFDPDFIANNTIRLLNDIGHFIGGGLLSDDQVRHRLLQSSQIKIANIHTFHIQKNSLFNHCLFPSSIFIFKIADELIKRN